MDPDQTARTRRLVWIIAGRKRITLVLSWRSSFNITIALFIDHKKYFRILNTLLEIM
jgi:hypothetical protein